ncbi:uncharacterized protein LOC106637208 [Copidosoma floridanum]|uniref:uncharacterized protein LOC106637208 n=1 Tax=Copidosoma floridanum TaxID=29053 RepID=UPI0006C9ABFD|nr:uncharacterized protein LOC106637208 [Copidosoma floridanum]
MLDEQMEVNPQNADNFQRQQILERQLQEINTRMRTIKNNGNGQPQIAVVSKHVSAPPYCKENPRFWFAQLEALFDLNRITSDSNKYKYVILSLDPSSSNFVSDIVAQPPETDKYQKIKQRILDTFTESDESKLRKLLSREHIIDEKPTHLLQRLKQLSAGQCNEAVLRAIFLDYLPKSVRSHLVVNENQEITQLAQQADKIVEILKPTKSEICAVETRHASHSETNTHAEIAELKQLINTLAQEVKRLSGQGQRNSRDRTRSRSRHRKQNKDDPNLCYYHNKFGDESYKCKQPCSRYVAKGQGN